MNPEIHISIGDLHGHLKALTTLLASLEAGIGIFQPNQVKKLKPNIQLILTGDYVDRGDNSRAVIDKVMELQEENPNNVTCLMGNHELLALADLHNARSLLNGLSDQEDLLDVYKWSLHGHNGGIPFIKNFGDTDRSALENYTKAMSREQPLGKWVRNLEAFSLKTNHGKKVLYVHGGIPATLQDPQKLEDYAHKFRKHMEQATIVFPEAENKYSPDNDVVGKYSPYWDRSFPSLTETKAKEVVNLLAVDYIVIGHTPQRTGIPANYGNCIFNLDVGMSPAYGENTPTAFVVNEQGPHTFQPEIGLTALIPL